MLKVSLSVNTCACRHGVVRFESVLKLQEELLERMKRIPKGMACDYVTVSVVSDNVLLDPREFLKLIFEYPPPAPHFISIRYIIANTNYTRSNTSYYIFIINA